MNWLNYHHLHYFWTVVQEGGIAAASRRLHVGRPSISAQIKSLEAALGEALFERHGRRLELTETGRLVLGYADEIFRTGRELMDAVAGRSPGSSQRLRVGVADAMAKLVTFRMLLPALEDEQPARLEVREGRPSELFAALALHELDVVLSDVPLGPGVEVKAYNHRVGRSTLSLFAAPALARRLRRGFPDSLDGAPMLLPSRDGAVRRPLEQWLEDRGLRPRVVAELEDSALMKVFGQAGHGVFPAPTVVRDEVQRQYGVRALGELESLRESFYLISPERRLRHPAVVRLVASAQDDLFA